MVQDLSPTISTAEWERRTEMLLEARAALDSLLACTATIIGAAIISTGVLRNATIPWEQARNPARTAEAIFPEEQVLAYGIFYSAVLALLYLPVYERLTRAARKLRDRRAPLIWPPREQWKERADERALLDRMLKLDQSAITGFRLAAGVLAPLASSVNHPRARFRVRTGERGDRWQVRSASRLISDSQWRMSKSDEWSPRAPRRHRGR